MNKILFFIVLNLTLSFNCWSMDWEYLKKPPCPVQCLNKPTTTPYTKPLIAAMVAEYGDRLTDYGLKRDRTSLFKPKDNKNILVADEQTIIEAIGKIQNFLSTSNWEESTFQGMTTQLNECLGHLENLNKIQRGIGHHPLASRYIPKLLCDHIVDYLPYLDTETLINVIPEKERKEYFQKRSEVYRQRYYGPYLSGKPSNQENVSLEDYIQLLQFLGHNNRHNKQRDFDYVRTTKNGFAIHFFLRDELKRLTIIDFCKATVQNNQRHINLWITKPREYDKSLEVQKVKELLQSTLAFIKESFPSAKVAITENVDVFKEFYLNGHKSFFANVTLNPDWPNNLFIVASWNKEEYHPQGEPMIRVQLSLILAPFK